MRIPAALVALALFAARAAAAEPLAADGSIPLAGVGGRVDHMAVDPARQRLFVAELGNNTLDVIDLAAGKSLRRIAGLAEPQGVGYSPKFDTVAVADAGDGVVHFYRGGDLAPLGTLALGSDADNVRVDPKSGDFLVGYGTGGIAVIDAEHRKKLAQTPLKAHPEGFQLDPGTGHVIVNVPDAGEIAVIDMAAGRQVAGWKPPGLRANFPIAIDPAANRVATVFRHPPRLVVLDSASGEVRATLPVCADADDVFFDTRRHRIYVSCGAGAVDVVDGEGDGYATPAHIKTASGARTSLFVPERDRLYVAARAGMFGATAAILVFRPVP